MKYILTTFLLSLLFPTVVFGANKPLDVPYTTQIPIGYWANPWSNACEESSIMMVDQYYKGTTGKFTNAKAIELIKPFFAHEDKIFGENYDSNSYRTLRLINDKTIYTGQIKYKPTLQQVKDHLKLGFPVISFHNGFALPNQNLHFRAIGSGYHVMVITGFDNETQEFITNDPGDTITGYNHRYDYDEFINTLGDFDHVTKKVNRDNPTVILTIPKLVSAIDKNSVYYIQNKIRYYVSSLSVFRENNWEWNSVQKVPHDWLYNLKKGKTLNKKNSLPIQPKLVIASGKKSVYLIEDNIRYRVSSPNTLKQHGWNWNNIEKVNYSWLKTIPKGDSI